jgi:hypothetical protein
VKAVKYRLTFALVLLFCRHASGKFTQPLDKGKYVAVFQKNGFKIRTIGFEVGEKGLAELRPYLLREPPQIIYYPLDVTTVPKK